MNNMKCGKCGYFDGAYCVKTCAERDEEDIITDCDEFVLSIYYEYV